LSFPAADAPGAKAKCETTMAAPSISAAESFLIILWFLPRAELNSAGCACTAAPKIMAAPIAKAVADKRSIAFLPPGFVPVTPASF
jgi:hypothetical protein